MPEIKFMTIHSVIESLKLKFTSGNSIPVERATITEEEFLIILATLEDKGVYYES